MAFLSKAKASPTRPAAIPPTPDQYPHSNTGQPLSPQDRAIAHALASDDAIMQPGYSVSTDYLWFWLIRRGRALLTGSLFTRRPASR
jgi:hypothetical protein